jgi:transcriptional regulator with XRE-family HTH domain
MNYLGVNIKKIRERWDLSQEEFGFLINASRGMIMQYERRGTMPKNETVSQIIKITGLTKDMLVNSELADDELPDMGQSEYLAIVNYRNDPEAYANEDLTEAEIKELARSQRKRKEESLYQAKYLEQVELRLKDLERDKQFLQRMLELNLGKASAMIQTVLKLQMGHDEVMMKSLDRLEKRTEGTLAAEADSLEMEIDQRLQNLSDTDKKVVSNK